MPKASPKGERPEHPPREDGAGEPKRKQAPRSAAPEEDRDDGPSDWTELADRASRKMRELADKAMPRAKEAGESAKRMAVDVSEGLDGAFAKVSERARDLMAKGQHTRVRVKFRGKQLAELPIAVVAAAEAASFWWFGPLRLV